MASAGIKDQKNQHGSRIADIAEEPLKTLPPMTGYLDKPIVTLEKAIEPLISFLPDVQKYAKTAKERCPKTPPEGLSVDESASIMLYTMNWKPREQCLNVALNAALRSEDRTKLEPWHLYLKLFLSALDRLPSIQQTVYRGNRLEMQTDYRKGKSFVWWGFSSCTSSIDSLRAVVFPGPPTSKTTFTIECKTSKDIRKHAYYPTDDEILILPATEFKVINAVNHGDESYMIQLQEVASYISLQQQAHASGQGSVSRQTSRRASKQKSTDDESSAVASIDPNNILVWLDANIDASDSNFRKTIAKIQRVIKSMHVFTDADKCVQQLKKSSDKNIFMIVSGAFGQNIVPIIHEMPQIESIFVFCGNKAFHEQWAKNWSKIKGVFTEIGDVADAVTSDVRQ